MRNYESSSTVLFSAANTFKIFAFYICCTFLYSCTESSDIIRSNPVGSLENIPGGYRYQFTRSSSPFIYQAPIQTPIYEFVSCDSIIGHNAYLSLSAFMLTYGVDEIIISEDAEVYLFEMPRTEDPNDFDAYVFYTDENISENQLIGKINSLLPSERPVSQIMKLPGTWLRVTPFTDRDMDYIGIFEFEGR